MTIANALFLLLPLLLLAGVVALGIARPDSLIGYWLELENWL